MEKINFREKKIIENFVRVCQNFHSSPREDIEDIYFLINNLKNNDEEKGEITIDFIKSLFDLNKRLRKETKIWVNSKKYELIRNDNDNKDGFADGLKQAKNRLVAFVRKAANKKQFKQTRKELFPLIVEVIQDSTEDELDIKYVVTRLIKLILSSLT